MNRYTVLFITMLLAPLVAIAQNSVPDSLPGNAPETGAAQEDTISFEQADSAYVSGDFSSALSAYEKILNSQGSSAALYYNIGNCYYRLGKYAKAVIAYERSLRLDPSDSDTRANLDFVNSKLVDRKGYEGSFLSRTFTDTANIMSTDTWAWIALLFFIFTIAGVAIYLFTSEVILRKTGFFGAGATALICLGCIIFALKANNIKKSTDFAVVTVPSSILSTSPREPQNRNEEAMLLHEGARVEILDSVTSPVDSIKTMWYDVQFDNDHRAWINSHDVEII